MQASQRHWSAELHAAKAAKERCQATARALATRPFVGHPDDWSPSDSDEGSIAPPPFKRDSHGIYATEGAPALDGDQEHISICAIETSPPASARDQDHFSSGTSISGFATESAPPASPRDGSFDLVWSDDGIAVPEDGVAIAADRLKDEFEESARGMTNVMAEARNLLDGIAEANQKS